MRYVSFFLNRERKDGLTGTGLDEKPKTLDKESSVAYDVAKELTDCPGQYWGIFESDTWC